MKLWIVGRINDLEEIEDHQLHTWDLIAVCSSEEKALMACTDENYYIGPIAMNQILPKEQVEWKGSYFPKRKN